MRNLFERLLVVVGLLSLLPFLFDILVIDAPNQASRKPKSGRAESKERRRIDAKRNHGLSQMYCPIPNISLDEKWQRYFEEAGRDVHECPKQRKLGVVVSLSEHEQLLVPMKGTCRKGALKFHYLDKSTFEFTSVVVEKEMLMPSDSGILRCEEEGNEAVTLLMHPIFNHEKYQRAKKIEEDLWKGGGDGAAKFKKYHEQPNILFIMVDSLSREQALRSLPVTLDFLKKGDKPGVGNQFQMYDYERFNVVSSGTHNNVPAYLAGKKYSDLQNWLDRDTNRSEEWILEEAGRNGYMTAFLDGEYVGSKSSLPRIRLKTFEHAEVPESTIKTARMIAEQMADHSVHSIFDKVLEWSSEPQLHSFGTPTKRLCFGGQSIFSIFANYVKEFWSSYSHVPKMVYLSVMDAHEPSMLRARQIDVELRDLLRSLLRISVLREIFVVLCGDHGVWYGEFYEDTKAGRLESKLPALFLLVPDEFASQNAAMAAYAKHNQPKLTTPYDVHATLRHIINLHKIGEGTPPSSPHALSLMDSFPATRTCQDANIMLEHCACTEFAPYDEELLNGLELRSLGGWAVEHINEGVQRSTSGGLTEEKTSCVHLEFGSNLRAESLETELLDDEVEGDSLVIIKLTTRGSALVTNETFEAVFVRKLFPLKEGLRPGQKSVTNGITLKKLRMGRGYEGSTTISQDAIQPFTPGVKVMMFVAQTWAVVEHEFHITIRWIKPNKETWKYSISTVKREWSASWQKKKILLPVEEMEGKWVVEVYLTQHWDGKQKELVDFTPAQMELGPLLGRTQFYLASDGGGEGGGGGERKEEAAKRLPSSVLKDFWTIRNVIRISPYAKHEVCRDKRVLPDFCVCRT